MKIYTIGFTKNTAEEFFEALRTSGAKRLVDVRLNNVSQLAGSAKKQDLAYFLKTTCSMDYVHLPLLAPTPDILNQYKKPEHCHRRLVAEYLKEHWGDVEILHLG